MFADISRAPKLHWVRQSRPAAVLLIVACAACSDPDSDQITAACTKATLQLVSQHLTPISRDCGCVAQTAKKYLDRADFSLFAKVSAIYVSTDDDPTKLHNTVNALMDNGVSPTHAFITATDFMFLIHKIDSQCVTGPGPAS